MLYKKPTARFLVLIGFVFIASLHTSAQGDGATSGGAGAAAEGKGLFAANCATCHALDKNLTGPALRGFLGRGPWGDRKELYKWVHNPSKYIAEDATGYTKGLLQQYGAVMQAFPQLSEKQIDAIADYVATAPEKGPTDGGDRTDENSEESKDVANRNAVIFGVISLIMAIIALILMQVNNSLKKLSDDKEGILRPEPVPFWRNKAYIALLAIIFFIMGGYFVGKGAIGLGRQKNYMPTQPIYYSHKVHAGVNQINCLYCHGSSWESKHAAIPSINVCMNCHKAINEYVKGPKLYNERGEEINGTAEIQKLYQYAGYTPGKPWDPSMAKPIEWIKIHNLPDHVYFNHAQHVNAGKVSCQTCHGNIQEMDVVYQASELSMGWCINCHRQSKVNFFNAKDSTGNQYYSIYEKFHNDIRSGKMDSVTVKDIGGLECQKCHY